ncbi:tail fiber assembly protein [Cupriavidus basilensis]|nr:tail assembly chaperone [Cupriavidus basilensis]
MLLHHFDSETGQYLSSTLAEADPRNQDRWLQPAFTTPDALPDRTRYTWPVRRADAWVLVPDYRGVLAYRQDTGEAVEVIQIGKTLADLGLADTPRPSSDYSWEAGGWALNSTLVDTRLRAEALAEMERRVIQARQMTAGKADAFAAGLLSDAEVASFKAWAAYQLAVAKVVDQAGYPASIVWPDPPAA